MTIRRFILTFSLLLPMVMMAAQKQDVFTAPSGKTVTITHIKHASVLIEYDGLNIYVDPVGNLEPKTDFSTMPKANIVLVTHEHLDHFDNLAIARLASPATAIYANKAVNGMLHRGLVMSNGDSIIYNAHIKIWAVPAYNTTVGREKFHPKGRDNGYIISFDGLRIYLAGDTEDIPEMAELKDIDVAFLPCNQPYTMTVDQLVQAANTIKPKVLFPYHFGETPINQVPMKLIGTGIDVRIRDYK
ncbi:MAG: MBL fold metallo-hydrolase [Prevotella sp.]|nr:MBL fold metallo-hydrolase [Prevotella sp.]